MKNLARNNVPGSITNLVLYQMMLSDTNGPLLISSKDILSEYESMHPSLDIV